MSHRIINAGETARLLGVSVEKFRLMRKEGKFPVKPLPYCKSRYDSKAVEQWLDGVSKIKEESADILATLKQRRLQNGAGENAIRH